MTENKVAKALRTIGIIEAICGTMLGLLILNDTDIFFPITLIVSSLVTCIIFFGFSEIIDLLQINLTKQNELINYIKNKGSEMPAEIILQDIEENLPPI